MLSTIFQQAYPLLICKLMHRFIHILQYIIISVKIYPTMKKPDNMELPYFLIIVCKHGIWQISMLREGSD